MLDDSGHRGEWQEKVALLHEVCWCRQISKRDALHARKQGICALVMCFSSWKFLQQSGKWNTFQ